MTLVPPYDSHLETVILDYRPRLAAYVRHFFKNENDVEDIIQDSFMSYWVRYGHRKDGESVGRLLFTIVRNRCVDQLRHNKTVNELFVPASPIEGELLYNADFLNDSSDSGCLCADLQKQITSVLESLSPRCREVFEMSRFQHKSNREIASSLNITVSTVEQHITKALAAFRNALERGGSTYFMLFVWMLHNMSV